MSANARSIDPVTPSQLESGKRDDASIQQSKALDRIWIYIPNIENLNPIILGKKILNHWEEMIMLMGMVDAFINAALNLITGWISNSMQFAILGCVCVLSYKTLRDNKTMQLHLDTFKSQLATQKQDHDAVITALRTEHQNQKKANDALLDAQKAVNTQQKLDHEGIISKLQSEHQTLFEGLKKEHTETFKLWKEANVDNIAFLEGVIAKYTKLSTEIDVKKAELRGLEEKRIQGEQEFENRIKALREEIFIHTQELTTLRSELATLRAELSTAGHEMTTLVRSASTQFEQHSALVGSQTEILNKASTRLSKKLNRSGSMSESTSLPSSPAHAGSEESHHPKDTRRHTLTGAEGQRLARQLREDTADVPSADAPASPLSKSTPDYVKPIRS